MKNSACIATFFFFLVTTAGLIFSDCVRISPELRRVAGFWESRIFMSLLILKRTFNCSFCKVLLTAAVPDKLFTWIWHQHFLNMLS
uniref:Putative secreted protein n=1 Tax=Rhipicephalus microplus TaxID=6941 RepID=A0A6M2DAG4_RHIMP